MSQKFVTEEMILRERDFLNAIHYRNKNKLYDFILYLRRNVSTSPNYYKYYSKIYLIDAFKVNFRDHFHQFIAAASDYALKKLEIEIKAEIENHHYNDEKKKFELFIDFFYFFEFALVEIEIAYYRLRRKNQTTAEARKQIFESHFGDKLLHDNGYEINKKPSEKLENKLKKFENKLSEFKPRSNRRNFKFYSNISAICHYRKHFIKDQLHLFTDIKPHNPPNFVKLSFLDYMNEANET
jgi:hypothetical protein